MLTCLLHAPVHQLRQIVPAGRIVDEVRSSVDEAGSSVDLVLLLTVVLVSLRNGSASYGLAMQCDASSAASKQVTAGGLTCKSALNAA